MGHCAHIPELFVYRYPGVCVSVRVFTGVFVVYVMFTCVCVRAFVGGWVGVCVYVRVCVCVYCNQSA